MKQKYILFSLFSLFVLKGNSQSNYAVNAIPFQQYTGSLTPLTTQDDLYSPVIALPFNFDFYGNTYNQIVISTNGYIDFRTNLAGQFSPWSFGPYFPYQGFPALNSIFGVYEDLNNSTGSGALTFGSYGTAPYRKFVVNFLNQPHFQCSNTLSSFQIVLSETTNSIDVNIISRQPCTTWQSGAGVTGIINSDGTMGIAAPGRNPGVLAPWTATNESWRFSRPGYSPVYSFTRCDDNTDGIQTFDLAVAANDLAPVNPSGVTFYETLADAQTQSNPIANANSYMNIASPQTIYASGNGAIKPVVLTVIDCNIDADNDTVANATEDANNDTNLANDDTDNDGIPNYLDNDDDGDFVLSNVEYVFARANAQSINALLDTDNDGIANYLDNDDDGDGVLTAAEDYNGDGNPLNDDTNTNGTPAYLESSVALGISNHAVNNFELFPNPASNDLFIRNTSGELITNVAVYSINGSLVKEVKANNSSQTISVSELQSGVYFVRVTANDKVSNLKFIKQ